MYPEIKLAFAIVVIIAPFILAAINLALRHKLPPKPLVLAHICKHFGVDDEDSLWCHVKITNPTAEALMTITHVESQFNPSGTFPVGQDLPRTLYGSQINEFGFKIIGKPNDSEIDSLLRSFEITDSLGRKTMSRPNTTVPAFGAIAH